MFIEVNNNTYVNLEQVKAFRLMASNEGYYWAFYIRDDSIESPTFKKKEEALLWFKTEIRPMLREYNNSKYALFEIATFLDQIVIPLRKALQNLQEVRNENA